MRNSISGGGGGGAKRLGEVGSRCWKSRIECSQDLTAVTSTNSSISTTRRTLVQTIVFFTTMSNLAS